MAAIIGTPRDDNLVGTSSSDTPTGADDIFGLAGNDRIDGRSGDDRLFGGPGSDRVIGSLGNDALFGDDDDDLLDGGPGNDQLFGGNGRDTLLGGDGADLLAGDAGDDTLLGGGDTDLLEGGAGNDTVFGDAGDDVLDGGPGNNRLSGDAGADRFILADFDVDEILDPRFGEGDVIDVSLLAQSALNAGAALDDVVRVEQVPAGTRLLVDPDGGGDSFEAVALLRGIVVDHLDGRQLGIAPSVAATPGSVRDLDGLTGFSLPGIQAGDQSGSSVGGGGDFNGDGFDDVIIGAPHAYRDGYVHRGEGYVIFGGASQSDSEVELATLDGSDGVTLLATDVRFRSVQVGEAVSFAGDVNGDGLGDIVIGAPSAPDFGGTAFVVYGRELPGPGLRLADLDGTDGFRAEGPGGGLAKTLSASKVSGGGDINGDGFADVVANTPEILPSGHVLFGGRDPGPDPLWLLALDGTNGFDVNIPPIYATAPVDVSNLDDMNGDGFDDVAFALPRREPDLPQDAVVVLGSGEPFPAHIDPRDLTGDDGFRVQGFSVPLVSGAGDVNGDGLADLLLAEQRDGNSVHILFGAREFAATLNIGELEATNPHHS